MMLKFAEEHFVARLADSRKREYLRRKRTRRRITWQAVQKAKASEMPHSIDSLLHAAAFADCASAGNTGSAQQSQSLQNSKNLFSCGDIIVRKLR